MSSSPTGNPLCLALDSGAGDRCLGVAAATADHIGLFKVGPTAFAAQGPNLVTRLLELRPVFLDLKLHDIPSQVAGAVAAASSLGVRYTTVHASGGRDMVGAAVDAAGEDTAVLAVTVLTSLHDLALRAVGVDRSAHDQVLRLAELALDAGAAGLVCSAWETTAVRDRFGDGSSGGPVLVVPGIRPRGAEGADQARSATPAEAMRAGADIVVVGRPITEASDPAGAAARIAGEAVAASGRARRGEDGTVP